MFRIVLLFTTLLTASSFAQYITWQRTYAKNSFFAGGYSIVQVPDEGYIAVGRNPGFPDSSLFAMRLDKYGNVIWTRHYGGGFAREIIKTNDGNYLIGGTSILKINIDGDTIWTRPQTAGSKFKLTKDNGFYTPGSVFVGAFRRNPAISKFDSLGYLQWQRVYSEGIYDGVCTDLTIDALGNLTLIGNFSDSSFITDNPFIMKTDFSGNPFWFRSYDSLQYFYLNFIFQNNDGKYISSGFNNNTYFCQFNSEGILEWIKYFESGVTNFGSIEHLIKTNDGGYAGIGYYRDFEEPYYFRLLKTDSEGNEQWRKLYGNNDADFGLGLNQTGDSGYILIGVRPNSQESIFIVKTDKTGYANPPVHIDNISTSSPQGFKLYQNYPNPFNPTTKIKFDITTKSAVDLRIYNLLGEEMGILLNEVLSPGEFIVVFDPDNLSKKIPSGIYFCVLKSNTSTESRKMLYIK